MTLAGDRILAGAREAVAVANGERPAASITMSGHTYVPRTDVQRERDRIADHLVNLMPQEIRLHMGELSAQEMRSFIAFIGWQAARIRSGDLA